MSEFQWVIAVILGIAAIAALLYGVLILTTIWHIERSMQRHIPTRGKLSDRWADSDLDEEHS